MALSGKLLRGTRFALGFKSDAYDLSATKFTLVARGPEGGTTVPEVKWVWRPGGASSPEFAWDAVNSRLVFTLSSGWTATGFTVGNWKLFLLVGDPPTTQDNMTVYSLTVQDGRGSPMPVT